MIITALLAILLSLVQTQQAVDDDTNVFLDLSSEHCATEIAFATYERTAIDGLPPSAFTPYVTYTAYEFETAEQAVAALEDSPELVAETFSDEPNISETEEFDQIVNQVDTLDYGDRDVGYTMTLPVVNEEFDVLAVEMLGIVKNNQLLLILMFSPTDPSRPSPALTLETIPPFAEDLDEEWDGTGDLQNAIPDEDEPPVGWEHREVTLEDPPSC